MAIDEIVASVARLISHKDQKPLMTGSGFFYDNQSGLHYVTNRHMVINENENYIPDEIILRLHLDPNNIQSNGDFVIPLYNDGNPVWKEHPTYGKNADVVAIPLDKNEISKKYFKIKKHAPYFRPSSIYVCIKSQFYI